jgi:hypothetical protein
VVDAALNAYFMYIVQRELIAIGLDKYAQLVKFNLLIIGFSLGMDILIIVMMSYSNSFV